MHLVRPTPVDAEQVSSAQSTTWLVFAVILNILVVLYLLPTLVALIRHVRNVGSIAVINVFLGWSFYGWVVALALACQHVDKPPRLPHPTAPPTLVRWPQPGWYTDPWPSASVPAGFRLRFYDGNVWTAVTTSRGSVGPE
jgi:hypothetical protein